MRGESWRFIVSDSFGVVNGLRQGCVLSPVPFSLYINSVMSKLKTAEVGVKCRDQLIAALLYADDMVMYAEADEMMRRALEKLDE